MYKCPYCNKEYENRQSYAAHISMCKYNPNTHRRGMNINVSKEKKDIRKEYICTCQKCRKEYTVVVTPRQFETGRYRKYCSLSCANSHIKSKEERNKIANSLKNSDKFYSSLLTRKPPITGAERKPYSGRKTYKCKQCGKEFNLYTTLRDIKGRLYCSEKCKNEFLVSCKLGGFREGSVKSYKSGWYKNIHCDSSWELAFVLWNIDHGNTIERFKECRYYIKNNVSKKYYPDFIVNNKDIYEIKGIKSEESQLKQKYNTDVIFLYKEDMLPYLEYVVSTYGKNFTYLYDKKDKE